MLARSIRFLEIRRMRRSFDLRQIYRRPVHLAHRMNIHQQLRLPSVQHIVQHFLRLLDADIMSLRDDAVAIDFRRAFDLPVTGLFLLEAALITDPVLYLTPLILTCRDTEYLAAAIPQRHFTLTAFVRAVAVGVYGFEEPDAVFEPEGLVRKGAYRADVDDVADKVVVERFLNIGGDLGMVTAIENSVRAFVRQLIGRKDTAITGPRSCFSNVLLGNSYRVVGRPLS
jgi:hypothetical protein